MPVAVVDPTQFERYELKSLEGAFVMLRPLPYGMKLKRRDKATKMYMEAPTAGKRKPTDAEDDVNRFELETVTSWAVAHDFAYCIGEHNLEDAKGNLLDLGNPMVLQLLDPRVGSEIETELARINADDEEESLEDFTKRLSLSSRTEESD